MESFRIFTDNSGLNSSQINSFITDLAKLGDFCQTTVKFLGNLTYELRSCWQKQKIHVYK